MQTEQKPLYGGKSGKTTDDMLDHMLINSRKIDEAMKLMDKLEIASPTQKVFFDRIRAVLK